MKLDDSKTGAARVLEKMQHNSEINKCDKKAIEYFYNVCISEGLSWARIHKYLELCKVLIKLYRRISHLKKEQLMALVIKINSSDYSENYKHDLKVCIKKFYKVVKRCDDLYPPEVAWLKTTIRYNKEKLPEELLTLKEVNKIIDAVEDNKQKSFITVLYETGARCSELTTLQIKNIWFDEYGAKLAVTGKTGMRHIRIIKSVPYLKQWLAEHPCRDQPDLPVWIGYRNTEFINRSTIYDFIKRAAVKAGISKRIFPHLFRHSRASELANYLTEAQLCYYFGWRQGSKMPQVYVHLSGRDIDNALLGVAGAEPRVMPGCNSLFEALAQREQIQLSTYM